MNRILLVCNSLQALKCFKTDHIRAMLERGCEVHLSAPAEDPYYSDFFENLGARVHNNLLSRAGLNPFSDYRYYLYLRKLMQKVQPQHVLNMTHKPVVWGTLAAYAESVPCISSMILGLGYAFSRSFLSPKRFLAKFFLSQLLKKSLKFNQKLFFFNQDDYLQLKQIGAVSDENKVIFVNGTGVDVHYFNPRVRTEKKPIFLMIARLLKDKGVEEFVNAARIIKRKCPDARFQILGALDVNPAAVSQKQLQKWLEEGVVEYLGETKDVRSYLAEASVFVLPSYREGLSKSILEAMSMGKPILTTDVPGCRELVEYGRNGYLVPARDSLALAQKMVIFLKNRPLMQQFGRRSREIILERYESSQVVNHVLSELEIL